MFILIAGPFSYIAIAQLILSFGVISIVVIATINGNHKTKSLQGAKKQVLPAIHRYLETGDDKAALRVLKSVSKAHLRQISFELMHQTNNKINLKKLTTLFFELSVHKLFIRQLTSSIKEERFCAARTLTMFPCEASWNALRQTIHDPNEKIRVTAAVSLVRSNPRCSFIDVLNQLRQYPLSPLSMATFFCQLPTRETTKLVSVLGLQNDRLSTSAQKIKGLLDTISSGYLMPFFKLLSENKDPIASKAALGIIERLGTASGTACIINMIASNDGQLNQYIQPDPLERLETHQQYDSPITTDTMLQHQSSVAINHSTYTRQEIKEVS